jgi:hypothetical protein
MITDVMMMNNDDGYLYDGDDRCIMMMHDFTGLVL